MVLSFQDNNNKSFNTQPPEGGWRDIWSIGRISKFQHTAARRRLVIALKFLLFLVRFQHTAARRRLDWPPVCAKSSKRFQHTAARRRLAKEQYGYLAMV